MAIYLFANVDKIFELYASKIKKALFLYRKNTFAEYATFAFFISFILLFSA
jgi:hypothetical protein